MYRTFYTKIRTFFNNPHKKQTVINILQQTSFTTYQVIVKKQLGTN